MSLKRVVFALLRLANIHSIYFIGSIVGRCGRAYTVPMAFVRDDRRVLFCWCASPNASPFRKETVLEQAPWHRRDVVGLPAGRPPPSGSRPRGAGSLAGGAARRRRPSAGSPAGGGVVPRRTTMRSKSAYGCIHIFFVHHSRRTLRDGCASAVVVVFFMSHWCPFGCAEVPRHEFQVLIRSTRMHMKRANAGI